MGVLSLYQYLYVIQNNLFCYQTKDYTRITTAGAGEIAWNTCIYRYITLKNICINCSR